VSLNTGLDFFDDFSALHLEATGLEDARTTELASGDAPIAAHSSSFAPDAGHFGEVGLAAAATAEAKARAEAGRFGVDDDDDDVNDEENVHHHHHHHHHANALRVDGALFNTDHLALGSPFDQQAMQPSAVPVAAAYQPAPYTLSVDDQELGLGRAAPQMALNGAPAGDVPTGLVLDEPDDWAGRVTSGGHDRGAVPPTATGGSGGATDGVMHELLGIKASTNHPGLGLP
jgi:hypothetical protein